MKIQIQQRHPSLVTWIIFLVTLGVVLTNVASVVFPALVLRSLGGFEDHLGVNPYEPGIWTYPFLVGNFIVFGLGVLYLKKKLPAIVAKPIRSVFNFEVSRQVAFLVITIVIGIYLSFTVSELYDGKFDADYYERVKSWLENYSITDYSRAGLGYHLGLFLMSASMKIFGSYKVIPFIASISLLLLTYFITSDLAKKRFAGIVAMIIVLQSGIFLMYDTSVAYPNFWILFYLLSLLLVYKKWPLSPVSYVSSMLSKALSAIFFPTTLFFIYRSSLSRKKKIREAISYGAVAVLGLVVWLFVGSTKVLGLLEFNSHKFVGGLTSFYTSFRLDGLILIFLLPLVIGLFVVARKKVMHADSIMFLITVILLAGPFYVALTGGANVPYRFIPLVVFFAIGVGLLLSKTREEPVKSSNEL
ncbi:MAG TPA: hypothetical protein VD699_02520 [Nitrosopumilaceae archaeon]|nr:hypothetical protein [Nitrosopumilaceae archaeon]